MNRLLLLTNFFLLAFALLSCNKNELSPEETFMAHTPCGVKNPVKDLPWLKEIINKAESVTERGTYAGTIHLVEYEGQSYFIHQPYVMSCMACVVYDCEGNKLPVISEPDKHMALIERMSEKNIIYRSAFTW
jgi:hypothetical protein